MSRDGIERSGSHAPALSFWASLTDAERRVLILRSRHRTVRAGTVLCRQGESANDVILIRAGWIKICVEQAGSEQIIAIRGPGDLVGERAAVLVRSRSATVVALDEVELLLVDAEDFTDFLREHPQAPAVLERHVYGRLTDSGTSEVALDPRWAGQNCTICFTDIAGFSSHYRTDDDRLRIREIMYGLLKDAFDGSQVPWTRCHHEDRGDGALIVIPPSMPTASAIDPLIAGLAADLRRHNHRSSDAFRIQLRVALHVGPVTADREGMTGEAIIYTARLLDAPVLKEQLARTRADLGFIASSFVYDSVIKHGPGLVDPATFRQVQCQVKEADITAWVHLSNAEAVHAQDIMPTPAERLDTGPVFRGDVNVEGDLVLGNKIEYHD